MHILFSKFYKRSFIYAVKERLDPFPAVRPEDVPILRAAKRLGVGEQDLSKIEIAGENLSSAKVRDFIFPELSPIGFDFIRVVKSLIRHLWLKTVGKPEVQT